LRFSVNVKIAPNFVPPRPAKRLSLQLLGAVGDAFPKFFQGLTLGHENRPLD